MPPRGLTPDLDLREAAGITLQARLAKLDACLVLDPSDPEALHDLRVSIRRLLAAMDAYREVLPRKGLRTLRREVRGLFRATGAARDLEVRMAHVHQSAPDAPRRLTRSLDAMLDELRRLMEPEIESASKAVAAFREDVGHIRWFVWGATGVPAP